MTLTHEMAMEALRTFRKEQKKRTIGTYTGCYCKGCVECMYLTLKSILEKEKTNG